MSQVSKRWSLFAAPAEAQRCNNSHGALHEALVPLGGEQQTGQVPVNRCIQQLERLIPSLRSETMVLSDKVCGPLTSNL